MYDGLDLVYLYDGTFEGLLSAVFDAYYNRENPVSILPDTAVQNSFTCQFETIQTDTRKHDRVSEAVKKQIGEEALWKSYYSFLSETENIGKTILEYYRLGFRLKYKLFDCLTEPSVLEINRLSKYVGHEGHLLTGFIRFSVMEGGVYFSEITPKNNVLPIVTPHFADRMPDVPFIIHDQSRRLAAVYDTRDWFITSSKEMTIPKKSDEERMWENCWKAFYDTIGIKERYNPRCRRNLMPKRFWRNMVEMQGRE